MRVLMLVQQIDERDWLRAFIVTWVRALAEHVDRVDVLTLEQGEATLPDNVFVRSMGKERGKNRPREMANFHRGMMALAPHADVIFSHMTPRYTVLATPYAMLFGKRQVLWYTHRHASRQLRIALRSAWRIATAAPESFPLPSHKVRVLGHGIDTDFFSPADNLPDERTRYVVQVARLMPIKHQTTLLLAIAAVPNAHAVFIGDVPAGQELYTRYASSLAALADELGISHRVTFTGGLLSGQVRDWYRRASVAVNLSPPGLFDKAALESMACGVPTVVSSRAFDALLGPEAGCLRIEEPEDVGGLTQRLHYLLSLPRNDLKALGRQAREHVTAQHSLRRLMPRLVRLFETGEVE